MSNNNLNPSEEEIHSDEKKIIITNYLEALKIGSTHLRWLTFSVLFCSLSIFIILYTQHIGNLISALKFHDTYIMHHNYEYYAFEKKRDFSLKEPFLLPKGFINVISYSRLSDPLKSKLRPGIIALNITDNNLELAMFDNKIKEEFLETENYKLTYISKSNESAFNSKHKVISLQESIESRNFFSKLLEQTSMANIPIIGLKINITDYYIFLSVGGCAFLLWLWITSSFMESTLNEFVKNKYLSSNSLLSILPAIFIVLWPGKDRRNFLHIFSKMLWLFSASVILLFLSDLFSVIGVLQYHLPGIYHMWFYAFVRFIIDIAIVIISVIMTKKVQHSLNSIRVVLRSQIT